VRLLGDADLRERLGAAARERARARYDWEAVTRRLVGLYEQVGATRPAPGGTG
jgi:glycosyltransferase involved in cell wall biosynthesis